ncbi:hypothetical protein TanjilG_01835 [Lupinus angustifolius]|uniref:phosphopantothenoylcysteine decarboxylase subunit VHS3 n=1 Tax=Lupinus angustifolius TaxID=3871 RepID=UPI00090D6135|nr:PREDICTED: phosphopantothenoylcysteine decarboxylase subunit VHS3 [Lupinus angustifolius]OIV91304.1 hypothetical protein TanjilG_01835 [Lupinus angustifolius]
MNIKGHADFSSYILFEASGDSEADCDPMMNGNLYEHHRVDDQDCDDDDGDDALSCSYDESDTSNSDELINMYDDDESCDDEYGDEKKENEELVDGVYGASYCEDDEMQEENQKIYVSSNSNQEFVDEMEKNRLFWEACLAS